MRVIEAWGVDKLYMLTMFSNVACEVDFGRLGFQVVTNMDSIIAR